MSQKVCTTMVIMKINIGEESEMKSVVKTDMYLFGAKSFPLERVTKVICDAKEMIPFAQTLNRPRDK